MIRRSPISRLLGMVLCICMVLSMLPGIPLAANAAEAKTMKIYFRNDWKWTDIKIYFWGSKTATNPGWPGKSMTYYGSSNNLDYYVYEVPTDVIGIIVNGVKNDGSGSRDQSPDIKSGWYDGITYYMYWNNSNAVKSFNIRDVFACKHPNTQTVAGYAATCTKDGLTDGKKCTDCGEMVTAQTVIPAGHKFVDEVCSVCGAAQYMKVYFRNDWNWSNISLYYWYDGGVDNKWPGDAMTFYDNDGKFDYYVVKVPTDVKGIIVNGIKDDGSGAMDQSPNVESGWYDGITYYMHWDGGNKVSSLNIADVKFPCKHANQEPISGKDATCTEPGLTEGIKCSDCDETVKAQTTIPALGHSWSDATCTEPMTCSVCGEIEGEAMGHYYYYDCDTDCYVCGQLTRPEAMHVSNMYPCCEGVCMYGCGLIMPATAEHSYECIYEQAPTCGQNGEYHYLCECGDGYQEYPAATGAHTYDNDCDEQCNVCSQYRQVSDHRYYYDCDTNCYVCGQLTRPEAAHVSDAPSCKDGVCAYGCGTAVPAATGHNWQCYGEKAPTCSMGGEYNYQCAYCLEYYDEYPPATGEHTYDNDCDADCNVCGDSRVTSGHSYDESTHRCSCGKLQPITVNISWNGELIEDWQWTKDYGTSVLLPTLNNPVGMIFVGYAESEGGVVVTTGENKNQYTYTKNTTLYAVFEPVTYEIWVQGIQITGLNASDVLGDLDDGATVTYAPATNTLTLNNANIAGAYLDIDTSKGTFSSMFAGIFAVDSLNLNLIGTNTVTVDDCAYGGNQGIQVLGELIIDGNGSLQISVGDAMNASYGIVTGYDLHIKSGHIYVTAGEAPVSVGVFVRGEGLTVDKEATLTASGDPDGTYFGTGIQSWGSITNNGAIHAVAIVIGSPVETLWIYGNAVLAEDSLAFGGYVFTAGSVLTVNEGVILNMSDVTADDIALNGTIVNNGTVIMPDSYTYATIPAAITGGTVTIGESSYIWNGSKYICVNHSWVDATCATPKTCAVCGATEGDPLGHSYDKTTLLCICGAVSPDVVASVTIRDCTTYYLALDTAMTAVKNCTADDNAKVTILQNDTFGYDSTQITITSGVFTLDLNGCRIGINCGFVISGAATDVTITSSSGRGGISSPYTGVEISGGSTVTINNCFVSGHAWGVRSIDSTITINDCTIRSDDVCCVEMIGGNVTINDCTLDGEWGGHVRASKGNMTIKGGSISGNILCSDSTITLTLNEDGVGTTFLGGIKVYGTTLNSILDKGVAYWQGDSMIIPADDATTITDGDVVIKATCKHSWNVVTCDESRTCSLCNVTLVGHSDDDGNGYCDICGTLIAKVCFATASLEGKIAINFYTLLSDEVVADPNAFMRFTMADGETIRIPVSQAVSGVINGGTYYVFACSVNAKEMADDVLCRFFYEGGSTAEVTYNVKDYGNYIINNHDDASAKALAEAMLNYGAASQLHFGHNTENLANAGLEPTDYSDVIIEGYDAEAGQGTDLAKLYAASLILKSETTLRFFFQVDSSVESFTVTLNGQALEVKQRSGLYYVDVVGIAAKDLNKAVTLTINDGTTTADVSFNPMSYCQGVRNDTTGAFSAEMKDLVAALYLYNQAANEYFKEG